MYFVANSSIVIIFIIPFNLIIAVDKLVNESDNEAIVYTNISGLEHFTNIATYGKRKLPRVEVGPVEQLTTKAAKDAEALIDFEKSVDRQKPEEKLI